jgi:hypothetical protein
LFAQAMTSAAIPPLPRPPSGLRCRMRFGAFHLSSYPNELFSFIRIHLFHFILTRLLSFFPLKCIRSVHSATI